MDPLCRLDLRGGELHGDALDHCVGVAPEAIKKAPAEAEAVAIAVELIGISDHSPNRDSTSLLVLLLPGFIPSVPLGMMRTTSVDSL